MAAGLMRRLKGNLSDNIFYATENEKCLAKSELLELQIRYEGRGVSQAEKQMSVEWRRVEDRILKRKILTRQHVKHHPLLDLKSTTLAKFAFSRFFWWFPGGLGQAQAAVRERVRRLER